MEARGQMGGCNNSWERDGGLNWGDHVGRGSAGKIDCILGVMRSCYGPGPLNYDLCVTETILATVWSKDYRAETRGWVRFQSSNH